MRNEHCSQIPGGSLILQNTGHLNYKTFTVPLKIGTNKIQWYLFVENELWFRLFSFNNPEIKINSIKITGTPPILSCTLCPAGTYNFKSKSGQCAKCPQNTFSKEGQISCLSCELNEYSCKLLSYLKI